MKPLKSILLSLCLLFALTARAQSIDVSKAKATPLDHFWSVGTCAGRVNEGLRTSWVEQLQQRDKRIDIRCFIISIF